MPPVTPRSPRPGGSSLGSIEAVCVRGRLKRTTVLVSLGREYKHDGHQRLASLQTLTFNLLKVNSEVTLLFRDESPEETWNTLELYALFFPGLEKSWGKKQIPKVL